MCSHGAFAMLADECWGNEVKPADQWVDSQSASYCMNLCKPVLILDSEKF